MHVQDISFCRYFLKRFGNTDTIPPSTIKDKLVTIGNLECFKKVCVKNARFIDLRRRNMSVEDELEVSHCSTVDPPTLKKGRI